jgi:hypothetical protein
MPISGWLHDSAFKDAAAHPLRLFWIIPWFRVAAIQDLPSAPKEALHSELFALHVWSAYALGVLVALHIIGALKHQFIDRHAELQRMGLIEEGWVRSVFLNFSDRPTRPDEATGYATGSTAGSWRCGTWRGR